MSLSPPLKLRKASLQDADLLFAWANDAVVRHSAFNSEPLHWDNHCRWLAQQLADDGAFLYIAMDEYENPVGQVRFNRNANGEFDIDVHTAPNQRGRGWGTALITAGLRELGMATEFATVNAFVKHENLASRGAFLKAGFVQLEDVTLHNHQCHHLVFHR